jgi:hypothetical protein
MERTSALRMFKAAAGLTFRRYLAVLAFAASVVFVTLLLIARHLI